MNLRIDRKKLEKLCRKHKIRLLVLHGSYATQNENPKSDIDIGVLRREKVDSDKKLAIMDDFSELFGDKFDPVFLNGAEPLISYQVAIHGSPLFEAEKGSFSEFRIHALARYMDSKKFRILEKLYVKHALGKE